MIKKLKHIAIVLLFPAICGAQDDLMKELEQTQKPQTDFVGQAFKGTRLINGHTIETKGKGELEFIFAHRFGKVNDGLYELFGLDQAFVRLGFEYGLADRLGIGLGRNSVDKTMDGYLKYRLIRQSKGAFRTPITVTVVGNAAVRTSPRKEDAIYAIRLEDRLSYTGQLLIARKFSPSVSLQLMPAIVHRNTVELTEENDLYALGIGGRIKFTPSVALTSEYYYRLNPNSSSPYYNTFGIGIDIETGGHIFQIVLTNTRGLTERAYLAETSGDFLEGDIHLGFNVTRSFQLKK